MLKILLIAAFLNGTIWILLLPIWQYPDEQSHFAQVQNIAEGSELKGIYNSSYEIALSEEIMGTSRDGSGNNKFTYHPEYKTGYSQTTIGLRENEILSLPKSSRVELVKSEATSNPPLYYTLAACFYKLFYNASLFTRIMAIRFFSLSIFMCTILISFQIGKIIFQKNNSLAITLASIIAFKPMLVYDSTGVLPDTLTNLLFTLVIFFSTKLLVYKFNKIDTAKLFLVFFAGFLTRQQFYISTLIIIFPILILIIKNKKFIKPFLLIVVFAVFIIYVINTYLTSVPIISNLRIADISIFSNANISPASFIKFMKWSFEKTYAESMPWFWGVYKWLSLSLPQTYYQIINRIVLVAIFGFLLKIFTIIKEKKYHQLKVLLFLIWVPTAYFITLTIWNYFFFTKNGYSFGIQGRYYFPVIVPIISIFLLGMSNLSKIVMKSFSLYIPLLLICMMLIFNSSTLIHVTASYYNISAVQTFIFQASQYKPYIFKGNLIFLFILLALSFQLLYVIKFMRYTFKNNETF